MDFLIRRTETGYEIESRIDESELEKAFLKIEEIRTQLEWSDLLKLPQVGENRAKQMVSLGISSLRDINKQNIPLLKRLPGSSEWHAGMWIATADSIRKCIAFRVKNDEWRRIAANPVSIYDIETDLNNRPWCMGVLSSDSDSVKQFFNPDDESKLVQEFFEYIKQYPRHILVSYSNSRHDRNCLMKSAKKHGIQVPKGLEYEIDLGILVINHTIGLPSTDLKGLANHFSFTWTHNDLVGRVVGGMVSRYYNHGEIPNWERLLEYNQEDVLATRLVLKELMKLDERELST